MNQNWIYSETVKDHFFNPRNFLKEDEVSFRANGIGEVGSPACGDVMKMWIKIDRKKDQIVDLKWKTFGCASAIGSTSMLSEMILENGGMKIEDALKITPADILKRLGGLPKNKIHCSVLGDKVLQAAIDDYFRKSKQVGRIVGGIKPKIICECLGVSERELDLALAAGDQTFEDFQRRTKAGSGCGKCVEKIQKMIAKKLK
ncbi:iron-sulfur cluster assembly scaffold protein [Candidatus Gracilibacteria bacterium]|nr:iron-sulfur cluster assembly scaffold protein [Candidatus Gracilibacteria bacterium]